MDKELIAQERITVLYPSPAGSWMIPVIAKEAKYFEREGITVDMCESAEAHGLLRLCSAAARKSFMLASRQSSRQRNGAPMS